MKVRNKMYKKNEYKGKEVECINKDCPCRPCYHVHDCGYLQNSKWVSRFVCLTNFNSGCPDNEKKAAHLILKDNPLKRTAETTRLCRRCGQTITLATSNFSVIIKEAL